MECRIARGAENGWGVGPRVGVGKTVWAEWRLGLTPCGGHPLADTREGQEWR